MSLESGVQYYHTVGVVRCSMAGTTSICMHKYKKNKTISEVLEIAMHHSLYYNINAWLSYGYTMDHGMLDMAALVPGNQS